MLVRQVMKRRVIAVKPDLTIREACRIMSQFRIGSVVVVAEGRIAGILTERDVLIAIAGGKRPEAVRVADVMTRDVITIAPSQTVEDAAELMARHKIKKLPVVEAGRLVGMVTASDLAVIQPKLIEKIASLISVRLPTYTAG
jgi:CBS domain-containing protein